MADDFATGYALGSDSGGGNNGGGFLGGEGIWAIILFAMIFGWGRGGYGGGGNDGGGGVHYGFGWGGMAPWATQADVRAAVDQQTLVSKLDQQTYGIADATYALNNALTAGFHGVDNALCTLGYNIQGGFNGVERSMSQLGYQMKDCCCETQRQIERGFADTNYNLASQFCGLGNTIQSGLRDVIDNQNANYRGIMDFMVQSKVDSLQRENDALRLRASQADQNAVLRAAIDASTAEIIRRTGNDCPVPSYLVQPPTPVNFPVNGCGTVQFGGGYGYGQRDGGCGCGCC